MSSTSHRPLKHCIFACIAPGSISGVAAADILLSLPAQWRAMGMGTAVPVRSGAGGVACESVTYLGADQGAGGGVQIVLERILTALKGACTEVGGGGAGEAVAMPHGVIVIVMDDVGLSARAAARMYALAMQTAALAFGDDSLAVTVQPLFVSVLLRGGGGGHLDAAAALAVQIYDKLLTIDDRPSPLLPRVSDHPLARCDTVALFSTARAGGSR